MKIKKFFKALVFVFSTCGAWLSLTPLFSLVEAKQPTLKASSQTTGKTIIVNGRQLSGPNSTAQQRNERYFLPIISIARALGDSVHVTASHQLVEVRRQTGTTSDFNALIGQVREDGSVTLVASGTSEIIFPPNPEEFMLPVEIVAGLLGAAIRYDESAQAFLVIRGETRVNTIRAGPRHSFLEIHAAEFEYNFNRYNNDTSQTLTFSGYGRIGDGRFSFLTNLYKTGGKSDLSLYRNGNFTFEPAGGQKFLVGDFGTGTDLKFLSANVRGVSAQIPLRGFRLTAFGGRGISGVCFPAIPDTIPSDLPQSDRNPTRSVPPRPLFRYDTNIYGVYATKESQNSKPGGSRTYALSLGSMRFDSPNRDGEIISGSIRYGFAKTNFQSDFAVGRFSGLDRNGIFTKGTGGAFDMSGSLKLTNNFTLQGRYAYTSTKYLSPQSGALEPVKLAAGGFNWQPRKWLTASLNGSTTARPDVRSQRFRFINGAIHLTAGRGLPKIFLSHTESKGQPVGSSSFTLFNASKSSKWWRLFMSATRIKAINSISINSLFGGNFRINDSNSFEISQTIGNGGNLSGMISSQSSNLLAKRLSLNVGLGYNRGHSSFTTFQKLSANIRLPRSASLQVSYLQTNAGATLLVGLRGSLSRKSNRENSINTPVSEMNSYGSYSGRVYQDVNLNGRYDQETDKPQGNVIVRIDGNRYVESDVNGLFRIEGVKAGKHKIYLDLLSVRADLTILDDAQVQAELVAGRDSIVDFRLARTGRVTGMVWHDTNENGKFDENEQTLSDVRLVAGNGRDTLTDLNGSFVIGDLPPGEYVILIDEKTLPEKTKSAVKPLAVKVQAGRETGAVNFPVISLPAEVKRFIATAEN